MDSNFAFGRVVVPAAGSQPRRLTELGVAQSGLLLKALSTNTGDIELGEDGFGAGAGFPLSPGESVPVDFLNPNQIYIRGTQSDVLAFITVAP